jgi:PAS domain-containing protein
MLDALPMPHVAFFSWDLSTDRFNGDSHFSEIFGLSYDSLCSGLPILPVMQQIVETDRPRIAEAIHRAIVTGEPYREAYRVEARRGSFRDVVAIGRCMRDIAGTPSIYSGTVLVADKADMIVANDPFVFHCRTALKIAQERHLDLSARYITSALNSAREPLAKG